MGLSAVNRRLYFSEPMLLEQGLEYRPAGVIVSRQMNPKPC
jgi:hypothetical protein